MSSTKSFKNQADDQELFRKIIGLGESSPVKSYYPELRKRLNELEKFRFLMNGVDDFIAVFEFGFEGRLINSNRAFVAKTGLSEEELEKCIFNNVVKFKDENPINWVDDNSVQNSNKYHYGLLTGKGGEETNVEFSLTHMQLGDVKYLVFIGRDITERLEKEIMLKKLNKMLEEKLEVVVQEKLAHQEVMIKQSRLAAMGEMIGNIAHQWRQPLCALGLDIQDILDAHDSHNLDREYLVDFTEKTMAHVMFMSSTIDNFRNYYKPNKEKVSLNITKILKETIAIIDKQLELKNVEIVMVSDCSANPNVLGYVNEFKQVVLNLLNNSFDALSSLMQSGKIDKGNINVNVRETANHVYVEISDNGGGIPQNVIGKVFEPYFTTKGDSDGTGVGLYMSKMIIENNMDGLLYVTSADGWTTFTVKLKKDA